MLPIAWPGSAAESVVSLEKNEALHVTMRLAWSEVLSPQLPVAGRFILWWKRRKNKCLFTPKFFLFAKF